MNSFCVH